MKKIILGAFLIFGLTTTLSAQTNIANDTIRLSYDVGDTRADGDDENLFHVKLINNSSANINFKVSKITSATTVTATHDLFFCDENCYEPITTVSPSNIQLNAASTFTTFSSHIQHKGNVGESMVKYEFFNTDISGESKYVVFKYNITTITSLTPTNPVENHYIVLDFTTGIDKNKTIDNFKVSVSPNPADNKISVVFANNNLGKLNLKMYDLLGNIVAQEAIPAGAENANINTTQLANGVYYLKLEQDNKIQSTKKIIISH